ncbi:membrane protein [Pseudomonas syringae pv. spinaceae]|uniref:Membrane protein n=1 Tax=Pseudomonas syringae pv. spinaceae TaxID=264459 RepID=A0A0Q0D9L0_PSESX|nr:membrane protein [Pseudomonas syringae pv. spinaceae]
MTLGRFAGRATRLGAFDAVVHGIAQQVHERVADLLDNGLVQFGFCAIDNQVDVFAQLLTDVAHHSAKTVEGVTDGDHAQVQRAIKNLFHQPRYRRAGFLQRIVVARAGQQFRTGAGDDQLTDQVDQFVELVGVDAHIAAVLTLVLAARGGALHCRRLAWHSRHSALIAEQFAVGNHRALRVLRNEVSAGRLAALGRLLDRGNQYDAVFADKIKHFVDRVMPGGRAKIDFETQVARLRVP